MTDYVDWRVIRMKPVGALTVADLRLLAAEIEANNAEFTAQIRNSPDEIASLVRDAQDAGAEDSARMLRAIATHMERDGARIVATLASYPAPEWWGCSVAEPDGVPAAQLVAVILGWHGVGMVGRVLRWG
jgi:hypothetical protein